MLFTVALLSRAAHSPIGTMDSRAQRSFSSVVYDDVAACVAHCLAFSDLAAWSAVNRDGRAAVRYKFDHCGLLNIAATPNITLPNFKMMCERLRGVQVILLPTSHPCLLWPDPADAHPNLHEERWSVQSEGLAMLIELMTANAAWFTAVTFVRPALPSTSSQCTGEMHICRALTQNMHRWPNCTLVPRAYPLPLKVSRQLIKQNEEAKKAPSGTAAALSSGSAISANPAAASASLATAASRVSSPTQLSLSCDSGRMLLDLSALWPSLETLEISFTEQDDQADHQRLQANFDCLQQAMHNFQSLLSVQLQFSGAFFPPHTVLSLHLPFVLQLMLIDHADASSGLGDLDLDCPRVVGLNLPVACLGSSDRPVFAPPRMLATLAKSTRLRALALINLAEPGAVPNLTEPLSAEQTAHLDAKAAALGHPSLFADPVNPARVFIYWLSTLPFAAHLELFEDFPTCVSIEEALALFPALKGYCMTPAYCFWSEAWLRPTCVEDPLNFEQAPFWREQSLIRSWDRLAAIAQESAEEFSKRLSTTPPAALSSSLSMAMVGTKLELPACSRLLQSSTMFRSLRIVFLASPCRVDAAAVRSLLVRCRDLHSLSLIQLANIGDQLFLSLPADFCKPSLRTLRLKALCDSPSNPPSDNFSRGIVLKLASLFPQLEHLEILTGQLSPCPILLQLLQVPADTTGAPAREESATLEPVKLGQLRILAVDPPSTSQQLQLVMQAWYARYANLCRLDPGVASSVWRLDFVQLDEPMSEDVYLLSNDWPTHHRRVQRRAEVDHGSQAAQRFLTNSVCICAEATCLSFDCRAHHNSFVADQIEAEAHPLQPMQEEPEEPEQQTG